MRLYKRGQYYWVAWPGDERESTKQTSKEAAERWCKQRELERADPRHAAAKAATVGKLIAAFLADRKGIGSSPATIEFYRQKLGHSARIFGVDCPLAALTAERLDRYIGQRREEGAVQHTIAKEVKAIGTSLRRAKRWGWLPTDLDELLPADLDSGYQPRKRWLPPAELELLLEELADVQPWYAGAVAFTVAVGARRAELFRATRGDLVVALKQGVAQVRGSKTEKSAGGVSVLSLFRPLLELALAHAAPGADDELAFPRWTNARRDILNACRRAGIAACTWNDLRRTHGRWLRQAGVEPELIAEQLRHASPEMARRVYAQIEVGEVGAQIEARLSAGCPDVAGDTGSKRVSNAPVTGQKPA